MVKTRSQQQSTSLTSSESLGKTREAKSSTDEKGGEKGDGRRGESQRHHADKRIETGVSGDSLKTRLDSIMAKYGDVPLKDFGDKKWSASETVMAHILNGLLSSTRISHSIATRTPECLLNDNYHDLEGLQRTSWQQRTEVLTTGGYTHYREKTATHLGDLADLMRQKYGRFGALYT